MKRKTNIATGVYSHLELSGVLDAGSEADIAACRKAYWNERKRLSKIEKHKKDTEFKIYLNVRELDIVAKEAKVYGMSRTKYIQRAALAYAAKQYMALNQAEITHIRQLLTLNYDALQDMTDGGVLSLSRSDSLQQQLSKIEHELLSALCNPKTIEAWISDAIARNPEYKKNLLQLLQK